MVRLRWLAKAKGFEKIVLKNEKLLAYFVGNQMSPYYRTRKFADIINYIQQKPGDRYAFKEQNSKLYLTVNRVRTIEGAYKVMSSL